MYSNIGMGSVKTYCTVYGMDVCTRKYGYMQLYTFCVRVHVCVSG